MKNTTDYTKDLEFLRSRFNEEDISIPGSLSEDNILASLPERTAQLTAEQEELLSGIHSGTRSESAASGTLADSEYSGASGSAHTSAVIISPVRTPVFRRVSPKKWIAAAACMLIAVFGGVQIYSQITAPPDTVTANGELYTFRDRNEISRLVSSLEPDYSRKTYNSWDGGDLIAIEESSDSDVVTEDAAPLASADSDSAVASSEAKSASAGSGASDHSETYLQVEDVDEADIVKTDGKYIYYVTDNREVVILEADNGRTHLVSRIGTADVENYIHDIFLKGDVLVTVGYVYDEDEGFTGVVTYDISDRSDPKMITSFRQTGNIISSRMVGDYVYLVTNEYVSKGGRIVPKCMIDGKFTEMPADSICCVPEPTQSSYVILSAMDITSGKDARCQTSAIFGASDDIYCNDHNLYAVLNEWDTGNGTAYTRIVRAGIDGLNVKFDATARVRGRIDNQFSMDEKDGYFRIATTGSRDGMDVNNLFVLDRDLKEAGSVTGFARNESIKAVRYFGDKAYVITYEQIDPLFIIDLSDPERPKIEGEVKIDGFSTLLVPAGEGKLLGIGHATGDNGYGGEYASGLKLVLFDISNPSEPKVISSKEFDSMDSPAQSTHKALTVNSKDGWYAVPYGIWHEPVIDGSGSEVIVEDDFAPDSMDAEAPAADSDEAVSDVLVPEEEEEEPRYEAGVLVFGADKEIEVYDQHQLGSESLTRSVYIGDYIYAIDGSGNVSSFRFTK